MEHKSNQFFRQKQIIGKKQGVKTMPTITLTGYDLINANFSIYDKVIVTYDENRIIIQRALNAKNCVILKEMTQENPALQYMIDKLGLILL